MVLAYIYPYQVFAQQDNPRGISSISKYPMNFAEWRPEVEWISPPQVLDMTSQGRIIRLVNFHMHPTTRVASSQAQARDLARLSQAGYPTILDGGANSAPLNQADKILASTYQDAWRQAGFGLGHTFPTPYIATGLERNQVAGIEIPPCIVRIDYIFYSLHWVAFSTWLAPTDGVSDHRGVLASFFLKD